MQQINFRIDWYCVAHPLIKRTEHLTIKVLYSRIWSEYMFETFMYGLVTPTITLQYNFMQIL